MGEPSSLGAESSNGIRRSKQDKQKKKEIKKRSIGDDHEAADGRSCNGLLYYAVGMVIVGSFLSMAQSSSSVQGIKTAIKASDAFDPGIRLLGNDSFLAAVGWLSRTSSSNNIKKNASNDKEEDDLPVNPNDNIPILSKMKVSVDADKSELHDPRPEKKDMNIVVFYADDWTFRTMGLVNKVVKTPNIDEIGRRGMLFPYNCVTTSICWQSRATLVTGKFVSVHRQLFIYSPELFDIKFNNWTESLYPLLKSNGYHVAFIGKWHAPLPAGPSKLAFDHKSMYYGRHWETRDGKPVHVTELNGNDAIHYLKNVKPAGKKFALTVSFFATHAWDGKKYPDQYMPQPYSELLYNETEIPTPKTATKMDWEKNPWFFTENNVARRRWGERYNSPERYQVTMKRYYRMATEVDDVVGRVVKELKEQGEYNNTYFVFTTDNGNFHGEHGLAGKWYPHEESVRVPLVIQDPRMPHSMRGTINNEFTLNIDLAPSILSAAGIPVPEEMQGRDMAELYFRPKHAAETWRKDFFYEWTQDLSPGARKHNRGAITFIPAVNALVAKDYKYFYWPQTEYEQLFRIENDPYEEFDIYNETMENNAELLATIKARFSHLQNISRAGKKV